MRTHDSYQKDHTVKADTYGTGSCMPPRDNGSGSSGLCTAPELLEVLDRGNVDSTIERRLGMRDTSVHSGSVSGRLMGRVKKETRNKHDKDGEPFKKNGFDLDLEYVSVFGMDF